MLSGSLTIANRSGETVFSYREKVEKPSADGSGPHGEVDGSCFVAGTSVHTELGAVSIENIQVGDLVWAMDFLEQKPVLRAVLRTFKNLNFEVLDVLVRSQEKELAIGATTEHPFWVLGKGWTPAQKLVPGDQVQTIDNTVVVVTQVTNSGRREDTYNFEVDELHNYFIDGGLLVHNNSDGSGQSPKGKGALPRVQLSVEDIERHFAENRSSSPDVLKGHEEVRDPTGFDPEFQAQLDRSAAYTRRLEQRMSGWMPPAPVSSTSSASRQALNSPVENGATSLAFSSLSASVPPILPEGRGHGKILGVSGFWRDPLQIDAVGAAIKRYADKYPSRKAVLSLSGVSNGQQAYSVSMRLSELGVKNAWIVASDISPEATAFATLGVYTAGQIANVRPLSATRRDYFEKLSDGRYRVRDAFRNIRFGIDDLRSPQPQQWLQDEFSRSGRPIGSLTTNVLNYYVRDRAERVTMFDHMSSIVDPSSGFIGLTSPEINPVPDEIPTLRLGDWVRFHSTGLYQRKGSNFY
jgi:hypothetical protein